MMDKAIWIGLGLLAYWLLFDSKRGVLVPQAPQKATSLSVEINPGMDGVKLGYSGMVGTPDTGFVTGF